MSTYSCAKVDQTFYLSETSNGQYIHEDDDTEHTLELRFTIHFFTQPQPYGETNTQDFVSEILDDSPRYVLDGQEVALEELNEWFGKKWTAELLDEMEDNAIQLEH